MNWSRVLTDAGGSLQISACNLDSPHRDRQENTL